MLGESILTAIAERLAPNEPLDGLFRSERGCER